MSITDTLLKFALDEVKYRSLRGLPDVALVRECHILRQELRGAAHDFVMVVVTAAAHRPTILESVSDMLEQYDLTRDSSSAAQELISDACTFARQYRKTAASLLSAFENVGASYAKRIAKRSKHRKNIVFLLQSHEIDGEYVDLTGMAEILSGQSHPLGREKFPLAGLHSWSSQDKYTADVLLKFSNKKHLRNVLEVADRWCRGSLYPDVTGHRQIDRSKSRPVYVNYHEDWDRLTNGALQTIRDSQSLLDTNMVTLSKLSDSLVASSSGPSR